MVIGHGGAREGSGRKKNGAILAPELTKKNITVRLTGWKIKALDALEISRGKAIEEAVTSYYGLKKPGSKANKGNTK